MNQLNIHLVCPERPDRSILVVGCKGDVEELLACVYVGEGAAEAALEVVPRDVVVLWVAIQWKYLHVIYVGSQFWLGNFLKFQ